MIAGNVGAWYCHGCDRTHTTDDHPSVPHHATARAERNGAVAEVPVYTCDAWPRSRLLRAVASVAADLAQMLTDEMGDG